MARQREQQGRPDLLLELLDWLKYILIAVLIGLLLVVFVIQRNSVTGDSMMPNLQDGNQLLVEKVTKYFAGIGYGDIVTIRTDELRHHEGSPNIIKRVVGLPGDTIEIKDMAVYRNGVLLDETEYLSEGTVTLPHDPDYQVTLLGEDEYYVLGDNRSISLDSRIFGPVPAKYIIGEVLLRFYPLDELGLPE